MGARDSELLLPIMIRVFLSTQLVSTMFSRICREGEGERQRPALAVFVGALEVPKKVGVAVLIYRCLLVGPQIL